MCFDHDYHLARERQELERARLAANPCALRAHLALARLHAEWLDDAVDAVAIGASDWIGASNPLVRTASRADEGRQQRIVEDTRR